MIGGGGAPLRYAFTSRGWVALSPWNDATFAYSILQIALGTNPISYLEVVSGLNAINLGTYTYHYNSNNRTQKYNPKVYIGTAQTLGIDWNFDQQTGIKYPENWPNSYQSNTQKGEAILCFP